VYQEGNNIFILVNGQKQLISMYSFPTYHRKGGSVRDFRSYQGVIAIAYLVFSICELTRRKATSN
jgi:hypothetical protein